jgi:DNA polymerase-3 subunit delta'
VSADDEGLRAIEVQPVTVWAPLVGQDRAATTLRNAATDAAARLAHPGSRTSDSMTHAWLITGPPGSGRSTAARAFAAAVQCPTGGCGTCSSCQTVAAGSHPDVEVVATELLSIGVKDTRELVRRAALAPVGGRYQVLIYEDADRLTDQAANALLKAVEEPAERTVWILCAPSAEDVLPTIRSRCRAIHLVTPSARDIAELLCGEGAGDLLAEFAAHASQGHIGRARRLAADPEARERRAAVLNSVRGLRDVPGCLRTAAGLLEAVKADVDATSAVTDVAEREALKAALGVGGPRERQPPGAAAALKELEKRQKGRATRAMRDGIDRALIDLVAYYRDVLARQLGADVPAVHQDRTAEVAELAEGGSAEVTLRQIEAVLACRTALDANVAPLLAVESMTLALR